MFPFGFRTEFRERLDMVYVCRQCGKTYLFNNDVQDHIHFTGDSDFVEVPVE